MNPPIGWWSKCVEGQIGKSVWRNFEARMRAQAKFIIPSFPEKLRKEIFINPYPKPTQVDEERILRRLEELLLRNSAKWCRNFGIRHAFGGEITCWSSYWRSQ